MVGAHDAPMPEDVQQEYDKIDQADGLAFIYPVWWSDCPVKLKGWSDRVLAYGYAYCEKGEHHTSKINIDKALVLSPAGQLEHLENIGIAESMRRVMVNDRLQGVGVIEAKMEILGGMVSDGDCARRKTWRGPTNWEKHFEGGWKVFQRYYLI